MEKKYFIKLDNNQEGPFSIDQLKSMNLTDEYDYWTNEFPFWRKITDFDELKDFILILPPKIINLKEIEIEDSSTKLKKRSLWIVSIITILHFWWLGGFLDKYDLEEKYSNIIIDNTIAARIGLFILSFLIGSLFGLLYYYYNMTKTYKQTYSD